MAIFYSSFVSTTSFKYNILNLNIDELQVLIDAFEVGKSSFFISGKKYYYTNIEELKIFSHQDFINADDYYTENDSIDFLGLNYITLKQLNDIGQDVTKQYIKSEFGAKKSLSQIEKYTNKEMDIFISHSSEDVKIAEALISLIRKSLKIESSKIRCTSVEGFKLPIGASTEEQLRQEIFSSKVFIALITKNSIKSTFVLFELGARWSTKEPLLPLICDSDGTSLLKGPLVNINALNATNPSDLLQFIEELGENLNLQTESASSYYKEVEELKELSHSKKNNNNRILSSSSESDDIIKSQAKSLWSDDYEMQIHYIESQRKAVQNLNYETPSGLSDDEFNKIRERAKQNWPLDFEMQYEQEKKQIESLRKLKSI